MTQKRKRKTSIYAKAHFNNSHRWFNGLETAEFCQFQEALRSSLFLLHPNLPSGSGPGYPLIELLRAAERLHWETTLDDSIWRLNPTLELAPSSHSRLKISLPSLLDSLPLELILMVVERLPHDSLRSVALLNRSWCQLVTPHLWHDFTIKDGDTANHVPYRVNSLIRSQLRMRSIKRLTIGPCTWRWTSPLLSGMAHLWRNCPQLSELFLESIGPYETERVGDFTALLLTLIECASSLRLTKFKLEVLLSDDSLLRRFLELQPTITHLIGVFMVQDDPHHFPSQHFLPNLTSIRLRWKCFTTATALVPGRPLAEVWLDTCDEVTQTEFEAGLCALQKSTACLTSLSISGYWSQPADTSPAEWVERLQTMFPKLNHLNIPDWPHFPIIGSDFHLPELRTLRLRLHPLAAAEPFMASLNSMEKLHKVYLERWQGDVWVRSTKKSSQSQWRLGVSEYPYDHPA
ncbi:hypothetical protein DL93DRAFT_2172338 [Clavulina sp. PMI_390]|nr:hypothetical protein DL93DRAFT_2172338 [Clavulina sp. PMI_390]